MFRRTDRYELGFVTGRRRCRRRRGRGRDRRLQRCVTAWFGAVAGRRRRRRSLLVDLRLRTLVVGMKSMLKAKGVNELSKLQVLQVWLFRSKQGTNSCPFQFLQFRGYGPSQSTT